MPWVLFAFPSESVKSVYTFAVIMIFRRVEAVEKDTSNFYIRVG